MSSPGKKQSNTKKALKAFKEWDKNRTPIYNNGKEPFQAADDEIFARFPFDKCLFVSNYGNIISFHNSEKPILLQSRLDRKKGRERYIIKNKGYMSYEVVANSFEVYVFGLAKAKNKKGEVEIHHIRKFNFAEGRKYNNDPELLEWVTTNVHNLLTFIQNNPNNRSTKLLERIAHVAKVEAPGEAVIITDNGKNHVGIYAISNEEMNEKIKQASNYSVLVNVVLKQRSITLLNKAIEIALQKDADYFSCVKYATVLSDTHTFIYSIKQEQAEITINDVTEINRIDSSIVISENGGQVYVNVY